MKAMACPTCGKFRWRKTRTRKGKKTEPAIRPCLVCRRKRDKE